MHPSEEIRLEEMNGFVSLLMINFAHNFPSYSITIVKYQQNKELSRQTKPQPHLLVSAAARDAAGDARSGSAVVTLPQGSRAWQCAAPWADRVLPTLQADRVPATPLRAASTCCSLLKVGSGLPVLQH